MLYQVIMGAETLYQGFDKHLACDTYGAAVEAAGAPTTFIFDGEVLDHYDSLDLTIRDDYGIIGNEGELDHFNMDDCEGLEFLL